MKFIKQRIWLMSLRTRLRNATKKKHTFFCPYCKRSTLGLVLCKGLFTQSCRKCNRTFLAMNVEGGARAVHHPDCAQGCGYHEPFGWVISADCTLHDKLPG